MISRNQLQTIIKQLINAKVDSEKKIEEPNKIIHSPPTKRKTAEPEESFEQIETNNRSFTNCLRRGLDIIAETNNDKDKTVGYYTEHYSKEVNEMKRSLKRFVPIGLTFEEAWRKANAAIFQERSLKRLSNNSRN